MDKLIDKYVKKRLPNMRKKLRDSARGRHRFIDRKVRGLSGTLGTTYNASRMTLKLVPKMPYYEAVWKGHGTWTGDNYIANAHRRESKYIRAQFEAAIDGAVREFNNTKRSTSGTSVHNGI